jgi:protease-4
MKDMGSVYRPLTEKEQDYAEMIVNQSAERFISDILSERPVHRGSIDDARVYRGEEAVTVGLVDELGNLNDAIEGARSLS